MNFCTALFISCATYLALPRQSLKFFFADDGVVAAHIVALVFTDSRVFKAGVFVAFEAENSFIHLRLVEDVEVHQQLEIFLR